MAKKIYYAGIVAYIVMLVLSVLFYKERTIFLDSAYDVFHVIKDQTLVNHNRYGGFFVKFMAYIAFKASLPLRDILVAYSAGFTAYNLIWYIICGSLLKKYDFALVILLSNILFVSETFYYIPSELPLGIAFTVFVFAAISGLQRKTADIYKWLLTALLIVCATFFHPLIIFVMAYVAIFFALRNNIAANRKQYATILGIFIAAVALKTVLIRTPYEQHSLGGLRNFVKLFPNYFRIYSNREFLKNCMTIYYWIPVTWAGIVAIYAVKKEWKRLAFFIVSFAGYLALVNISYAFRSTPSFYIENLYLPLGVFLALPLVFDVLPVLEKRNLALPVFSLILLSGCARVWAVHSRFTARLDYERAILKQYGDKKIVLDWRKVNAGILQMLWGTPYEFWLLSTVEQGKTASIIIDDNPKRLDWASDTKKSLLVNWNVYPYVELPKKYFIFADTTTGYVIDP